MQIRSLVGDAMFAKLMSTFELEITEGGFIKSAGFNGADGDIPGFLLRAIDGILEAYGARFRNINVTNGTFNAINVTSGTFDNISIGRNALFLGTISTGPVYISNENTASVAPQIFASGTSIATIRSYLGGVGTFSIYGSYGARLDIRSIIFTMTREVPIYNPVTGVFVMTMPVYSMRIVFASGNDVFLEDKPTPTYPPYYDVVSAVIGQQLSIGGSESGKTFVINNLPEGGAGLPTGTVYRNGNQLMIA